MNEPTRDEIDIEVRYAETDQMGVVHHANYLVWFELARTSLCTRTGYHYADIERLGYLLMVSGIHASYRGAARYGDTIKVTSWVDRLASRALNFAIHAPDPHRHKLGPRRRRGDRPQEVHLRHLGRHGERGEPDGIERPGRIDPRFRGMLPPTALGLRIRGPRNHPSQGAGRDAHVFPEGEHVPR